MLAYARARVIDAGDVVDDEDDANDVDDVAPRSRIMAIENALVGAVAVAVVACAGSSARESALSAVRAARRIAIGVGVRRGVWESDRTP